MKADLATLSFLGRYVKRHLVWGVISAIGILTYAAATAGLLSLMKPIFSEVLLAGDKLPGMMGALAPPPEEPAAAAEEETVLDAWKRRLDLSEHLESTYESVKERLSIGPDEVVYFVPLLFVAVFLVRSAADFVSGYAFQRIGFGVTTDIRNDLYRRILEQSSRFHAEHPSGELVARVINDVALMQSAVSNRLLDLFQQSLTLFVLLALLLTAHGRLALTVLVVAPVLVYPIVRFGKGMRKSSHRSQERMADLAGLLAEGVRGHRVVKAFGMEEFENRRFREATRRHLKANLRAQMLAHGSSPVVEALAVIGAAALLIWAGRSIRAEAMTPADLVQFLTTLLAMYDPIRKLNKVNLILQEAMAAGARVSRLLAVPNDVTERPGAEAPQGVERAIAYEGVSFAYGERPVLSDVNLTLKAGEIVALVGPSGGGKSTMVNLLPRFFDPQAGRITLDGVDLRDLTLAGLRSLIGIVTQDTVLFNDTVRNNIAYGRADLPLERVREAARAAYADEFVQEMPEGYDTVVGEGGLKLSGGQRQRLAIARALLKDAPILILDEATSALDSHSEDLVQKALLNLMQGRTTLVIAHRLSTVRQADRIVVMEAGRITEQGTHDQLLALGGTYKRLYDLQFRV